LGRAITADAGPPRRARAFGGRRLFQPPDSAGRQGGGDELCVPAHDALTSSLTSFVYRPAANPLWQERVREEGEG
jgi:hypothetical protein